MRVHLSKLILGLLLSLLVSFNLGFKQFVHSFEDHEETVHHCNLKKELDSSSLHIEEQHHHCDYLTELLHVFVAANPIGFSAIASFNFSEVIVSGYKSSYFYYNVTTHLVRGPPKDASFLKITA